MIYAYLVPLPGLVSIWIDRFRLEDLKTNEFHVKKKRVQIMKVISGRNFFSSFRILATPVIVIFPSPEGSVGIMLLIGRVFW